MYLLAVWTQLLPKAAGSLLGVGDLKASLSAYDVTTSIVSQDDRNAVILINGKLRPSVEGISAVQNFQYPLKLVFEKEQWVVCDKIVFDIVQDITLGPELAAQVAQLVETPTPAGTLSVEQAVQATIQADQAIKATTTQQAALALTPTATPIPPTPTSLSEEERQLAIATSLAAATIQVEVPLKLKDILPSDSHLFE